MRIAIASGKGGTGKTFVSTNLFEIMNRQGCQTILADCDAEVPNDALFFNYTNSKTIPVKTFIPNIQRDKCTYCGICSDFCHYHSIICIPSVKFIKVTNDICHSCKACQIMCPKNAILSEWKNAGKISFYSHGGQIKLIEGKVNMSQRTPVPIIEETINQAINLESDYLILDAPPGCSCPFVHTVLRADFVILVTEPTPFGLSDLKQTVEVLHSLNIPFGVIVNKADTKINELKNYFKQENIEILSKIPYSQEFAIEYSKGELAVRKIPEMTRIFEDMVQKIKNHENSNR